jgi:2-polyprenyl-3-methyl-5-hydroxy-6-metoxy-1,4-benzoquinol methylase
LDTSVIALICAAQQPDTSDELAFAERELLRDLSAYPVRYAEGPRAGLLARARHGIDVLAIPDDVTVLFLAHGALWLAPRSVAAAIDWVDSKRGLGLIPDVRVPALHPVPDYLTLRGFEDYAERLSATKALPRPLHDFEPLAFACKAGLLRHVSDPFRRMAEFMSGTFAHDFSGYHQSDRSEMLRWLPPDCRTVLDVGGGEGRFLQQVKAQRGCETHLAEFAEHACQIAREHVDHVWQGDFLATDFGQRFDCISFFDVLEHAANPALWLKKARTVLNPEGSIVLSIPNVGHWSVITDLLAGRWDYAPIGIHCVTHLRFFTRRGIERLVDEAGFYCERIEPVVMPSPEWFKPMGIAEHLPCDHDSINAYAYHVRARVKP